MMLTKSVLGQRLVRQGVLVEHGDRRGHEFVSSLQRLAKLGDKDFVVVVDVPAFEIDIDAVQVGLQRDRQEAVDERRPRIVLQES